MPVASRSSKRRIEPWATGNRLLATGTHLSLKLLALFGGSPIRTRPFPSWPIFGKTEEDRLLRTLHSGEWGRLDGRQVEEFERRFARMHGCAHGVAVVNGTVSLRIALLAAGIQAEDEVIVPPYTFLSTASAVVEANAVPVFADINLETFNLDPGAVEAAITPRTRAIIPVHFAGQPADMDALRRSADAHGLTLIESVPLVGDAPAGNRTGRHSVFRRAADRPGDARAIASRPGRQK